MKKTKRLMRFILRDLLSAQNGLEAFTMFRRYKISPAELSAIVTYLERESFVDVRGSRIILNRLGKEKVMSLGHGILAGGEKPWRNVPEEFTDVAIAINQPVAPMIWRLDKELLPKRLRNKAN